ncbi:MAG TPA: DUF1257 domain-containing protein [bacterium]|nr:DUF1257 domain-containing protein [bacterium]
MSAIFVVAPLLSAAWPAISAAAVAAASALGFTQLSQPEKKQKQSEKETVELDLPGSQVLGESLAREEEISFVREGITVTFRKDIRGRCGVRVCGEGLSRSQLTRLGRQLSQRLVQEYVKDRVLTELRKKGFQVAEEEVTADRTVRLLVRKWR